MMIHFRKVINRRVLLLGLFMQSLVVFSQDYSDTNNLEYRPLNNIFLNISGDASIVSLNYERLFPTGREHFFFAAGLGVGVNTFVTIHANNGTTYTLDNFPVVPHHITGNLGGRRSFFEFGFGGAFIASPQEGHPYLPSVMIGYRHLPMNMNRVNFRVFVSYPLASLDMYNIVYVPAGVSVGWSF